MKVLIFENEFTLIENAFKYVNDFYFGGQLEFKVIPKSQDLAPFSDIVNYDVVFIDISLATRSEMDGYAILKKIEDDNLSIKKIVILTGNHNISEGLINRGITKKYPILTKPIDFNDLKSVLS